MSYDHYVAICKPLCYTTLMTNRVCHLLVLSCWATGFLMIFPPVTLGLKLEFCASNVIDHFICDSSPILQISCSDTHFLELMSFLLAVVTLLATCVSDSLLCLSSRQFSNSLLSNKGLFYLFFPHDCSFHFLWKLHLHVHKSISQWQSDLKQSSSCAQYLSCLFAESLHLYPKEPASETGL